MVTNQCASYCRFCFRKRYFGDHDWVISLRDIDEIVAYIAHRKEIKEVLLTGGDPLMIPDDYIEHILRCLRTIRHLEVIRIGTRVFSTLPQRITKPLARMLKRYHPIWINTQFNVLQEVTAEAARACDIALSEGIPLGNQSVLLRHVNDSTDALSQLWRALIRMRVRPYYLFHCSAVRGASHFRTSEAAGRRIMKRAHQNISGVAIPRYVHSTPHGKIPIQYW
jgi:lysine 2,3-aminomutase